MFETDLKWTHAQVGILVHILLLMNVWLDPCFSGHLFWPPYAKTSVLP